MAEVSLAFAPYVAEAGSYLTAAGNFSKTRGLAVRFRSIEEAEAFVCRVAAKNVLVDKAQILICAWKE
jgi:hypothetical protein